jgi:AcrR family transcriptional regulator
MAAGASSLERTLELLWRDRTAAPARRARGPAQRLTVDDVVAAGVALADAEGLAAFSMRKVADKLGVGAMSLYTYVPGREELIGLMTDQVMLEAPRPPLTGGLRSRLTTVAETSLAQSRRHPWLLDVDTTRPWIGPGGSGLWEWQLSAVDGVGLDDLEMDQTISLVLGFTAAAARAIVGAERTRAGSDESDLEWWERTAPVLDTLMDGERYPISARVGTAAGQTYEAAADPERWFRFGLERVLDGLEAYLHGA